MNWLLLLALLTSDNSWADAFSESEPAAASDKPAAKIKSQPLVLPPLIMELNETIDRVAQSPPTPQPPVELPPPKQVASASAVQAQAPWHAEVARAIRFDAAPPPELMQAPRRRKLALCVPDDDPNCWTRTGSLQPWLKRFRDHPLFEVTINAKRFARCKTYPAMYDPETRVYFHDRCLDSWSVLIEEINSELRLQSKDHLQSLEPLLAANAGGFSKAMLGIAVQFFRFMPECDNLGSNRSYSYNEGIYSLSISEDAGISWSTLGGETTIRFKKPGQVAINLLPPREMSAVIVRADSVTLCLDWWPDWTLEAE